MLIYEVYVWGVSHWEDMLTVECFYPIQQAFVLCEAGDDHLILNSQSLTQH